MDPETQKALSIFYSIQQELKKSDDSIRLKQVNQIIAVLESDFYSKMNDIYKTLDSLNHYTNISPKDIELENNSITINKAVREEISKKKGLPKNTTPKYKVPTSRQEFQRRLEKLRAGRELVHVQIAKVNQDQTLGVSVNFSTNSRAAIVEEITPGGVASKFNIKPHDEIIAVNGIPLDNPESNSDVVVEALKKKNTKIDVHIAKHREGSNHLSLNTNVGHVRDRSDVGLIRELNTELTQYEVIELDNRNGFGFGITSGLGEGLMVRTIVPGGSADKNGRLQLNDHLMYINDICVRHMSNADVAEILKNQKHNVQLIVARPFDNKSQMPSSGKIQMVETENLDERLKMIVSQLYPHQNKEVLISSEHVNNVSAAPKFDYETNSVTSDMYREESEDIVEKRTITLPANSGSLGITVSRYHKSEESGMGTLDGIYIKEVQKNSAANAYGIKPLDKICAVNGRHVDASNIEKVLNYIINSGDDVTIDIMRYISGPTYSNLVACALETQSIRSQTSDSIFVGANVPNDQYMNQMTYQEYPQHLNEEDRTKTIKKWKEKLGEHVDIVIANFAKFTEEGGLGVSLEGTVDVDENGSEIHPHHYIRSIIPNGPAGRNGILREKDELLEANGVQLYGLNHLDVVGILKHLPLSVQVVCVRNTETVDCQHVSQDQDSMSLEAEKLCRDLDDIIARESGGSSSMYDIKAKSQDNLDEWMTSGIDANRSRSLDQVPGLAVWDNNVIYVDLEKTSGLGFSVLDYQDPVNPQRSVIVIRSLVPNGAAAKDGRIYPGDRLMSVNKTDLSQATMLQAVEALKTTETGIVRLGIVKALCLDNEGEKNHEHNKVINNTRNTIQSPHLEDDDTNMEEYFSYVVPEVLEQKVKVKKLAAQKIGLRLESEGSFSQNENGFVISAIDKDSPAERCGMLNVGDFVTKIDGNSIRDVDKAHVEDLLRRTININGEISINYIPESDYKVFMESKSLQDNVK